MQITYTHDDVTIRDVPPTPVAIMEHRGDRATLGDTIERFIAWRKAAGLSPETSPTFNVFRSERTPAIPADYSMDLCVGTDLPIAPDDAQMKPGVIPGGRCAVLRVFHDTHNLEPPRSFFIGIGFQPVGRTHATSPSIASGTSPSSRARRSMMSSWNCSCP